MFKFAVETYADVIDEIKPLIALHWAEIAVYKDIPLDPEFEFYEKANAAGMCAIYTARRDGELVGYAIFFMRPSHIHYRGHGWAMSDIIWVHPAHRRDHAGVGLCRLWDEDLKTRGIHVSHVNIKVEHTALMYLLKSEGYGVVEAGYEKRLN